MHAGLLLGVILSVILGVIARSGVDLSVATDASTWNCLVSERNISFAIIRAYRSSGVVDINSANSMQLASNAGIKAVDAYMFPCISTSPYSLSHNITCDSADKQVADTLGFLKSRGISATGEGKVTFGRIWLDIEDESPSKYFDPDASVNQAFIADMVSALKRNHVRVGIYSTKTYWANIMNNDMNYGQYPLWYPRYDAVDSFDFFAPFAAWTSVDIKQTGGDVGYCGISQVDSDFIQE